MATQIGVSPSTYSSWERERTEPDVKSIIELARFFNVTVDELLRQEVKRLLKIGACLQPESGEFNPFQIEQRKGFYNLVYPSMFNRLFVFKNHRFNIELIESYEENEEARQYIFSLKSKVSFHNGSNMERDDVKTSYDCYLRTNPQSILSSVATN